MPKSATKRGKKNKRPIEPYQHTGKQRINNPPVGLVTPQTDPDLPTHKTYDYPQPVPSLRQPLDYDPHLCRLPTPDFRLPVFERIDPRTIVEAVRRRNGSGLPQQPSLFERRQVEASSGRLSPLPKF
jgi:adenine-specific DNA-methyltransferase